jgi:hypothetical protein
METEGLYYEVLQDFGLPSRMRVLFDLIIYIPNLNLTHAGIGFWSPNQNYKMPFLIVVIIVFT